MSLKDYIRKIFRSKFVKLSYKTKFYFDTGITQIQWITGKFPEIMGMVYMAEKFGFELTPKQILIGMLIILVSVILLGLFWKKSGLFDIECYVKADKEPVQKEILEAARIIKRNEKKANK